MARDRWLGMNLRWACPNEDKGVVLGMLTSGEVVGGKVMIREDRNNIGAIEGGGSITARGLCIWRWSKQQINN